MSTLIKNLHIKNFKSVRDLSLECDRINIFIGKPNAGKSNILEAISLLGVNFPYRPDLPFQKGIIRYKSLIHLFNNFDSRESIEVFVDSNRVVELKALRDTPKYNYLFSIESLETALGIITPKLDVRLNSNGEFVGAASNEPKNKISSVKKYNFIKILEDVKNGLSLNPPHGDNFYAIVESNPSLRTEIQRFVKPNGLEFLLDIESQKMAIVQKTEDTLLSFPLHLVPDTFQRYIFHLAAIMSNRDSVLLFEEPESHSYPPYIHQLAQHIVDDEGGNQYFITTHNPYLLTPILQEAKDVALFVTWFEDYQTHAKRLSETEVGDILDYWMDIFLNLKHFIPHEPSPDFA